MRRKKTTFVTLSIAILVLLIFYAGLTTATASPPEPDGTPAAPQPAGMEAAGDRLAVPVLPENPSQVETGSEVYYYDCMPCHGDRGQGLTDEFRQIWVEDHQNCWGRGCHAGRLGDEGFPLPKTIPAVSHRPDGLSRFPSPNDLFNFLQETHPPQRPGALQEDEYWAVTAFILDSNNRLAPGEVLGPQSSPQPEELQSNTAGLSQQVNSGLVGLMVVLIVSVLIAMLLLLQTGHSREQVDWYNQESEQKNHLS